MTNSYNNNSWLRLHEWNFELAYSLMPVDLTLTLYMSIGMIGNSAVVYIYGVKMNKKLEDKFFILALAILDGIVSLTSPLLNLVVNIMPVIFFDRWTCKMMWFVARSLSNVAAMLIIVIAFKIYLKVCRPFGWQMTLPRQKISLILLVALSSGISLPMIWINDVIPVQKPYENVTGYRCGLSFGVESEEIDTFMMNFLYFVLALICFTMVSVITLYSLVARKLYILTKRKTATKISTSGSGPSSVSTYHQENGSNSGEEFNSMTTTNHKRREHKTVFKQWLSHHRFTLMFMTISVLCAMAYFPSLVIAYYYNMDDPEVFSGLDTFERNFYFFLNQLYISNHVVNPFIYGLFDRSFRSYLKKILCN